jgi:hypothetical protein
LDFCIWVLFFLGFVFWFFWDFEFEISGDYNYDFYYLFNQEWGDAGHALVDNRVATARAFIERGVKTVLLRSYVSVSGRFDIEALKIDMTRLVADKDNEAALAARMQGVVIGA